MTQVTTVSGKSVRPYAFGTMQFGGRADAQASEALFNAALDAGITHFDTAYLYNGGESETLLGRFAGSRREDLYIATKACYHAPATAEALRTSLAVSLERLGMDFVDLLYLHRFDPDTPLEETLSGFAELQSEGSIRHIGLSNFAAWQVMKAQGIARSLGTRIDAIQPMYNLVKRQAEVEILPMAADQAIAVYSYSPLGGGLLTGKYARGEEGRITTDAHYAKRYSDEKMHQAAGRLTELAKTYDVEPATLAAAWVAHHPLRPRPILSARSVEQLRPSLAAMSFEMDATLYAELSALMPAPPPATDRLEEQIG
ncbi:aldo/keto reductase [Cognatishimia sp. F0-27]|uniref:aldo/keto reductase n=1 Tax=Cognatishimia sp. F0-27 TaxID=2816855 RepID=UPI001D0C0EE4|nr:aldo/keto reductase [Cognatishimia sp. F0-27]MCC1493920.1 aldo/keto reductase [Cognatishimia sp. F0-27]